MLQELRLLQPVRKDQLELLLKQYAINYTPEQFTNALQFCQIGDYAAVEQIFIPRKVMPKKKVSKLEPLVEIFSKMDSFNGKPQQLSAMRLEAEYRLKRFIFEAQKQPALLKKIQEGVIEFQKDRIRLNNELGKKYAKDAVLRLQERTHLNQQKQMQEMDKFLREDDNLVRANRICSILQKPDPFKIRIHKQCSKSFDQRFNWIMQNKII